MIPAPRVAPSCVDTILEEVCLKYGVTRSEFLSSYRAQRIARARQDAAYRLRTEVELNPRQIGVVLRRSRSAVKNLLVGWEARAREATP